LSPCRKIIEDVLDFDTAKLAKANLGLISVYGLRNVSLMVLGFGVIQDKTIITTLTIDVSVWIAMIVVWCVILNTDAWTPDNVKLLSIAGLMSALQLNTFLLLNAVLDPLVAKTTFGSPGETVSLQVVQDLIQRAEIAPKYKIVLLEELRAADYDHTGVVDQLKFFEFDNKAMLWLERWSLDSDSSHNTPDKQRQNQKALKELLNQL
jgi:hypothetical protein